MKKIFLILIMFHLHFVTSVRAQLYNDYNNQCIPVPDDCKGATITVPNVYDLCPGGTYTFSPTVVLATETTAQDAIGGTVNFVPADFTLSDYSWSPGGITPASGTTNPTTTIFSVDAPAVCTQKTYTLTVNSLGPNLIDRGDFAQYPSGSLYDCMASLYFNGEGSDGWSRGHIKIGNNAGMGASPLCGLWASETADGVNDWALDVNNAGSNQGVYLYYWGQTVNLCPNTWYHMTYWVRCWASSADPVEFEVLLGSSVSGTTYPSASVDVVSDVFAGDNTVPCDPIWHEVSFSFNSGTYSGPTFICMWDPNTHPAYFAVDGITLQRENTAKKTLTVGSVCAPIATISANANVCLGSPFVYTINGTHDDVVTYTITLPDGGTITGSGTIGVLGTLTVNVPAADITVAGTLCMEITGISEPSYGGELCPFSENIQKCATVEAPVKAGEIDGISVACANDPNPIETANITSPGTGALNYLWTISGPGFFIYPVTGMTESIVITGPGTITLTCVVSNAACPTSLTLTKTIIVHPNPAVTIVSVPPSIGTDPQLVLLCDGLTPVPLVADVTSGGPGTSYVWTTTGILSPLTGADVIATPSAITATTYSVTVRNEYKCSATTGVEIDVAQQPCICHYEENGSAPFSTMPIGAMTAPPAGGNWSLMGDIIITKNMTWTNVVVAIGEGVNIRIQDGVTLTLDHCHLFSCGTMWNGISYAYTGKLIVQDNTLIEDAKAAVNIDNPDDPGYVAGNSATTPLVLSTGPTMTYDAQAGAIFNKNGTGVLVNTGYNLYVVPTNMATDLNPGYPYVIQNTVFTSRDFSAYHTGAVATTNTSWPFVWPGTAELKQVTTWPGLTAYEPPYRIDDPNAYGTGENYPVTVCNNGQKPYAGIDLESVDGDAGYEPLDFYSFVVVGTIPTPGNNQLNMFDNMCYGVYAYGSNLAVRNSVFMHMAFTEMYGGGKGIYSNMLEFTTSDPICETWIYGSPTVPNLFYDCGTGVETEEMWDVEIEYAKMYSNRTNAPWLPVPGEPGYAGILVGSQDYFHDIQLNHNTIYNIMNPIAEMGTGYYTGQIAINNNTIRATTSGTATTQSVGLGIYLDNEGPAIYDYEGEEENVNNNVLDQVYNGILVNGSLNHYEVTTIDGNTINMSRDLASFSYSTVPQMAIELTDGENAYINDNTISGVDGATYNTPPVSTTYGAPVMEGIHVAATKGVNLCTNTVTDLNTGYFFGGTSQVQWLQNTMTDNAYGYALDGIIGPQPNMAGHTAGNKWNTTAGFTWTGTNYETYNVLGSGSPTASAMTVQPTSTSSTQQPIHNSSDLEIPTTIYSTPSNGITISTAPNATCPVPAATGIPARHVYQQAAQTTLAYAAQEKKKNWIAQMTTWEAMQGDTTLDSTAVLTTFHSMANSHSRYKYLAGIEKDIAEQHYALAETKLAYPLDTLMNNDTDAATGVRVADDTAGNDIVHHYKRYYHLLIKYRRDTLTTADSAEVATLANMCPYVDGTVVYKARGLYNRIYPIRTFSDLGCEESDSTTIESRKSNTSGRDVATEQGYMLYPNPSDGHIMLQQKVPDDKPVQAEVYNATGASVYKGVFQFSGGLTSFTMHNKIPGVYVLHLTDSNANEFILKFTIE